MIEQGNLQNGIVGKGIYSLSCAICGRDERTRVVVETEQDRQGSIIKMTKARVCDPCSENGLSDAMMGVGNDEKNINWGQAYGEIAFGALCRVACK